MNELVKELICSSMVSNGSEGLGGSYAEINPEKLVKFTVQDCADWIRENYDSVDAEVLAHYMEVRYGLHRDYAE